MKFRVFDKKIYENAIVYFIALISIGILTSLLFTGQIQVTKFLTDSIVSASPSINSAIRWVSMLFVLLLCGTILKGLNLFYQEKVRIQINYNLDKIFLEKNNPKKITKIETPKYQNDLNVARYGFNSISGLSLTFIQLINAVFSVMVYSTIIFNKIWFLPFIVLLLNSPKLLYESSIAVKEFHYIENTTEISRERSVLQNFLLSPSAIKEVLIFAMKPFIFNRWNAVYKRENAESLKFKKQESLKRTGLGIYSNATLVINQFVLIYFVVQKNITIGDYVSLLSAVTMIETSFYGISSYYRQIKQYKITTSKLSTFFTEYSVEDQHDNVSFTTNQIEGAKDILITDLTFQYPEHQEKALQHLYLNIKSGEKIAVVGENGSGKSTLAKLLCGLHSVDKNTIYVNGIDITEIHPEQYFSYFSIVTQDFIKYPFSLIENIALTDYINHEKIGSIKENYPFLLPNIDLDTVLGYEYTGSRQLSGGQWQKIALARALYKNSDILILDEATSALDPESEYGLIDNIIQHESDRTIFYVTHRLNLCPLFDRIIVMKDGHIVENGPHHQLLQMKGNYYKMYNSQQLKEEKYEPVRATV